LARAGARAMPNIVARAFTLAEVPSADRASPS
jgi:hypothetical protein